MRVNIFMDKTHGGNIWKVASDSGIRPGDIIDFSASINPLGLSPDARRRMMESVSILGHYPEPCADMIRQGLARFHNLSSENIIAGNGSTEFIHLLPQIFRPKRAIIVEPAFSEYRNALELCGCEIKGFLSHEDKLIVIRSMTKFFGMAGLRLGYIISNKRLIKRFEDFKPPWSVNTLAIIAGIESLQDTDFIMETTRWFEEEREFLYNGLNAIAGLKAYPSSANYFLVKILQKDISSATLQAALL